MKKGHRSSKRKGDRHFDYKTGDRPSELLERAIDLFKPQMDAD
ncbi:hypothetical protein QUA46_10175 [Microcoleus sp. MON2_D6]